MGGYLAGDAGGCGVNQRAVVDPSVEEPIREIRPLTVQEVLAGWVQEREWLDVYTPLPREYSTPDADCVPSEGDAPPETKVEAERRMSREECKRCWLIVERSIQKATGRAHRRASLDRLLDHMQGTGNIATFRIFAWNPGAGFQEEIRGLGFTVEELIQKAYDRFMAVLTREVQEENEKSALRARR